ncbi:MFS transporter [Roseburia sp. 831b]|uniref:MFS transporter n=1 Tax=Roseburia sp. 831b TaxID=1261635 RepID=UPI000950CAE7|nr:MFS transporter [Roseburia sp. 831b]MDY5882498.1 MFS transporter [Roseburia sp.]WVK72380.1 MFS transporter [Roseburia sp. 831b]
MHFFSQYKGLRKENYILFLGRIVTNLGSMVWPVLTLILNQKLGMSATGVALVTIVSGILLLPAGLMGGRLADKYNKRNCIIICDLISIFFYIICAVIPLSYVTIALIIVAAACQSMEYPAYNALIADITYTKDRERAFSLQYLGANIGLIASPTIAGILFKNYLWLAFLISGIAIGVSTFLIFWQVRDIEPVKEEEAESSYQENRDGDSLIQVLKDHKVILLYIIGMGLYGAAYQQYGYLMPLDMGRLHGENGAVIFGSVSSLNCIVVVLFTPIFTKMFAKITHTKKNLLGQVMLLVGYAVFLLMLGHIPAYYVAITLFTFGEILTTIVNGPYLTARIPASHRGRMNGFMTVVQSVLQGTFLYVVGVVYDNLGSTMAWGLVIGVLLVAILLGAVLIVCDKKKYHELYE